MWYNKLMAWLLRSPLHGLVSKGIMLISVTGRKSGKTYTTPVNYVREGNTLWLTSTRSRSWWRNLKGGAPVSVLLAGQERKGRGLALTEVSEVSAGLVDYFRKYPKVAKYFDVAIDDKGQPSAEDCARAAQERIMVRIDLDPT